MTKFSNNDVLFLPLGGSNEIGMNVNLYHQDGKWLMVDLGAGFADKTFPGVSMLAPDLSFICERRDKLAGLVLTHSHEDHMGSVGYLWRELQCPIYATPFTAAMVRNKLEQADLEREVNINIVEPGSRFNVDNFDLEMIELTHSIPEMNALVLHTPHGKILHTGDWKFDPNPVVGPSSNFEALENLGKDGVLAMVCDSTNVFNERFSGSEGDLRESMTSLISEQKGLVVVTTFASNVARMDTLARAAKACGRRIIIAGWSLRRVSTIARETGYLEDIEPFLSDKEFKQHPREKLLVICTGCQGEPNAAMNKIATGNHPTIRLTPKDTVIFSSKIIPGNEKTIFKLFNLFVRLGCEVFTEKDHFVHVSGHPSRQELIKMYEIVKPDIAIPVHGEPVQLHEHVKLAKKVGVAQAIEIRNGEMVRLAPGKPESLKHVQCGYLAVDGYMLQPEDGEVMVNRRRLRDDGLVMVSLAITADGALAAEPKISTPGVLDNIEDRDIIREIESEVATVLNAQQTLSDDTIYKATRQTVRRMIKEYSGKFPLVEIHLLRS